MSNKEVETVGQELSEEVLAQIVGGKGHQIPVDPPVHPRRHPPIMYPPIIVSPTPYPKPGLTVPTE